MIFSQTSFRTSAYRTSVYRTSVYRILVSRNSAGRVRLDRTWAATELERSRVSTGVQILARPACGRRAGPVPIWRCLGYEKEKIAADAAVHRESLIAACRLWCP